MASVKIELGFGEQAILSERAISGFVTAKHQRDAEEFLRRWPRTRSLHQERDYIRQLGRHMGYNPSEILTKDTCTPVAAVAHRVVEQRVQPEGVPDRFSYALFVDSSLDTRQCEGLYRFDPQAGLVLATDFNTFLDKILTDTYDRDTQGLY
jgi:hypothetical protein